MDNIDTSMNDQAKETFVRGRGRPRGKKKNKEVKPKGKPGRPLGSSQPKPTSILFTAVLSFLTGRTPGFLHHLASIPDHRKCPELCTFPIFQIRVCELLWMLSGGKSGLFFDDFLVEPQVTEAIGQFCQIMGQPCAQHENGTLRMPTVDTLKDDLETMLPEELIMAWHILVQELDQVHLFRGTRYENMPIVAIDGVDGFRTVSEVPKLLHRNTTGKNGKKHLEHYAKYSLASLCHPIGGAGFPIAGVMIKNREDGGSVDGKATKQQCEYNALEEVVVRTASLFPELKLLVLLDGLYLDGNNIRIIERHGHRYGMTFKDDALAKLHAVVEVDLKKRGAHFTAEYEYGNTCESYEVWHCNDIKHDFNGVETPMMNYLYLIVTTFENGVETGTMKFGWITNLHLDEKNSLFTALILRRRWGVETMNNDLKNLGVNLTHKFDSRGNGPENFATMGFIAALLQSVLRDSNYIEKLQNQPGFVPLSGKSSKAKGVEELNSQIRVIVHDDFGEERRSALLEKQMEYILSVEETEINAEFNELAAENQDRLPVEETEEENLGETEEENPGETEEENLEEKEESLGETEKEIIGGEMTEKSPGKEVKRSPLEKAMEEMRQFLDRQRRIKAEIARVRVKRRWHTREGWCDYLCKSMQQATSELKLFKVPVFTMLWNLTNQRK